jgi:glutaredoxin
MVTIKEKVRRLSSKPSFIHKKTKIFQNRKEEKMKTLTAIYLDGCPYCQNARMAIRSLTEENPAYKNISIHWIEENRNAADCKGYDYYYAPSFFLGKEKLYEAQPGQSYEEIKAYVKEAFDKTLAR